VSTDCQKWRKSGRLGYRLQIFFGMLVFFYIVSSPWQVLGHPPAAMGIRFALNITFAVIWSIGWVWILLQHRFFRKAPAAVIAVLVVCQAVYVDGIFADCYYALSAQSPRAFEPSPLTGSDAAYFTISTATTTGMGDIHPASSAARLIVSGQMVASLYLVVIAIGTAVGRVLDYRSRDSR
jgi:hypothetical protein